eukprot:g5705.t1
MSQDGTAVPPEKKRKTVVSDAFELSGGQVLRMARFKHVTNMAQLVAAAAEDPLVALLRPCLVPGAFPVLVAAHKAAQLSDSPEGPVTFSDSLVVFLSAIKHVPTALSKFGASQAETSVLLVAFSKNAEQFAYLTAKVQGERCSELFPALSARDHQQLLQVYKISKAELSLDPDKTEAENIVNAV